MLNIFADTFHIATRADIIDQRDGRTHWPAGHRFDNRRDAELEAHRIGRRRV